MVPQVDPARRAQVVVILDHDIPAGSFQSAFRQKALIDFSRANSLEFIQSAGISYQLLMQGRLATGSSVLWGCIFPPRNWPGGCRVES